MSPTRGYTAGGAASSRPPWWMFVLAVAFAGYFSLLLYCDLRRPEPIGVISQSTESGMILRRVTKDSPAARAGLEAGDRVVQANGRLMRGRLDWLLFETNLQTGQPISLEIDRHGRRRPATLVLERAPRSYWTTMAGATLLSARTVQLVTLFLAIVVAIKRPFDRSARIGAWMLATLAVYSIVLPYQIAATWRALPDIVGLALWIPFASSLAIPAILLSFFALFPRPIIRSSWAWCGLWAPAAIVLFLQLDFAAQAVYRPASTRPFIDWTLVSVLVTAAYALAAAVALVVGYQRLTGVTDRRRVRMLVIGSLVGLIGVLPVAGLYWWPTRASLSDSVFASPFAAVATMVGLALPISFTYAIVRHRLFDVRFIVRRGLQYALARRGLVSVVPVIVAVFLIDLWINREIPFATILQARGWGYGALAGVAILARAGRDRWLDALDRRFFREHYNAQRLLRAVGADVRAATSLEIVAPRIVAQVEAAIHPEWVALVARDGPSEGPGVDRLYRAIAIAPVDKQLEPFPHTKVIGLLQLLQRPVRIPTDDGWLARHFPNDLATLHQARIELLVPVLLRPDPSIAAEIEALFALGPKRSEEPYSEEDEDLLIAIGENLAALLERGPAPPPADETFDECPHCGVCYEAGAGTCPHDSAELTVTPIPRLLGGRYQLARRIGRGGMGTVYEAYDIALERRVAAKVLREDVVDGPNAGKRFQSEARLAAALAHPNVVTVHDIGVTRSGRAFFVMELLVGITLREELQRSGRLQPARVLHLLGGICAAVSAAHQRQMIHRDLKPENIVLCGHQPVEIPKVLDFGLAKALEASGGGLHTRPGLVAGTPHYMAPEHLRGGEPSPDWDLWALSVIAFEMVTGVLPRSGGLGAASTGILPTDCRKFFERALSDNPIDRPTSVEEFYNVLERVLPCDVPDSRDERRASGVKRALGRPD